MQNKGIPYGMLISDAHIKKRLWTNNSLITGDSYAALDKLKKKLPNDQFKVLFSCGDLFDVIRPSAQDVAAVLDFCDCFDQILYVDGNHDKTEPSWLSSVCPRAVHLTTDPVEFGDCLVFGIDYTPVVEDLLEALTVVGQYSTTKRKILLMHQALKEFLSFEGSYACTAEQVLELVGNNVTVFCGDIHKYDQVYDDSLKSAVVSPGPVVPQDIGQVRMHGGHYCEVHKNGTYTHLELIVRDFYFCKTSGEISHRLDEPVVHPDLLTPVIYAELPFGEEPPKPTEEQKQKYILVVKHYTSEIQSQENKHDAMLVYTITDAIHEDIKETSKNPDKMIVLADALLNAEDPGDYLDKLMNSWKIVR